MKSFESLLYVAYVKRDIYHLPFRSKYGFSGHALTHFSYNKILKFFLSKK